MSLVECLDGFSAMKKNYNRMRGTLIMDAFCKHGVLYPFSFNCHAKI